MADFPVVELPETDHPGAGEAAPDFTRPLVTGSGWRDRSLYSLLEECPVVLFCFPMDGTGTARSSWVRIRERGWGDDGAAVIGISISTPHEHVWLLDRHDLPYGMFSDPGAGVADLYGIPHDYGGMAGLTGHRPSFFVIDSSGRIRFAWVASRWPEPRPYDAVERALSTI
ncbi:MAG: redoxin domain-containing protein [Halobacteriales archaeon]|nr:redoxin domain-containing protein [Halobacteriales archaeon]